MNQENRRVIDWCISNCVRRNDIGSLSWFLYLKVFLGITLSLPLGRRCFELACPITDLQLMHLKQVGLCNLPASLFRGRYAASSMSSAAWLPLYEVERRGWDTDFAFQKLGTNHDITGSYSSMADNGVAFYRASDQFFTAAAFTGWRLEEPKPIVEDKMYVEDFIDDLSYFYAGDADEEIYK